MVSTNLEFEEINPTIDLAFSTPVYYARRKSDLDASEKKDIEDIIEEGMRWNEGNTQSQNSSIFDTRLYNLKEFCEQHIKIYVKEIINPLEELDFYITQSWLNVNKPGESHHRHWHSNSIISGVFYLATEEDDKALFFDPNQNVKRTICIPSKEENPFNAIVLESMVKARDLLLFPSWLEHAVPENKKATKDRISLSFNVFAKGTLGTEKNLNELIL